MQPPIIPLFPVVKKDLTFLHEGKTSYATRMRHYPEFRVLTRRPFQFDAALPLSCEGQFQTPVVYSLLPLRTSLSSLFFDKPKKAVPSKVVY